MHRKLVTMVGGMGVAVLLLAAPASAMDCFVVNRSLQGTLGAGNSSQWVVLTVTDALGVPPGRCANAINAALTSAGLPVAVATRSDKILLDNLPAREQWLLSNGKGIDHLDESPIIGEVINVALGVLSTDSNCTG